VCIFIAWKDEKKTLTVKSQLSMLDEKKTLTVKSQLSMLAEDLREYFSFSWLH